MATIVGQGDYKYEIKENWAKLPDGWSFKEVAAVGVDRQDNVYCFTRGEHPVIVFDRDASIDKTMSIALRAASTRSSSSTATAIFCVPGARVNTFGRTASIWAQTIRST